MEQKIVEEVFERVSFEALKSGERRLVAIAGEGSLDVLSRLVNRYAELREGKIQLLYSNTSIGGDILGIDTVLGNLGKKVEPTILDFDDSEEAMGGTWDVLLADFSVQMRANDVGRLVETIRGGGLILFALPSLKVWFNTLTLFQRKLVSPPFTERDVRHAFKRRFISNLRNRSGVWFVDMDSGRVEGLPRNVPPRLMPKARGKGPVRSLAITNEQLEVIDGILKLSETKGKSSMVIVADRGRGKSAALGLGLSRLMAQGNYRKIVVTAPTLAGAKTLFHFLKLGLKAQGLRFRETKREEVTTKISSRRCTVVYVSPVRAAEVRSRIKVVDEAASIPTYVLFSILRSSKLAIFSTTVHGYEGAGRSFSLRFLERLRRMKGLELVEIRMKTPIRYPEDDPVEEWLYDFLLLDAEPADVIEEPPYEELKFSKLDLEEASENLLKQFYGIYVLAHYRNRPNDLALLLDAPHHTAWAITYNDKVLVSVQLAEEGKLLPSMAEEMLKGWEPPGHMIPNRMVLHYGFKDFAKLWGWRIVRIATHPSLQGRGLGSLALKEIEQKARDMGIDWIGAGFGASPRLLNFWLKNGFIPIHISPSRNPTSGEFSVFVLKPLNNRTERMVEAMSYEFKNRFLGSLHDVYFGLSPSVARLLLTPGSFKTKLRLSMSQRRRLKGYLVGTHTYEMTADAIGALVKHYFIKGGWDVRPLKPWEEDLIVAKTLQGRGWDLIRRIFKIDRPLDVYREIIGRLVKHYVQKEGLAL